MSAGWPRGAQVRRTLGVRLSADSSKKTRQALRRWTFANLRPALGDPTVDGVLVAFGGTAPGTLHAPEQPMAQRPHVRGMVAHAGQPPDHGGDALQGPQLAREPIRRSTLEQRLLDRGELGIRQPRRGAARSPAAQGIGAARSEAGVPDPGGLGGDAEPASDLGLAAADSEQLSRSQPASLEPGAFSRSGPAR